MKLRLRNFGPVKTADITFGDLTVFVGPQASGKSVTLQLFKLLLDGGAVQDQLDRYGFEWDAAGPALMEAYFGEGMQQLFSKNTRIKLDGKAQTPGGLSRRAPANKERVYYIPAQRVLSLSQGWPKPFGEFSGGDPFVLREFSDRARLVAEALSRSGDVLFPRPNQMQAGARAALGKEIFGGFTLYVERNGRKRLMLRRGDGPGLPMTAWSAGQREFVPMLLGLLELVPGQKTGARAGVEWVILEELESGLHPRAIQAVLCLVLDLLHRGYRVCLSTHSTNVLDLVWALRVFREKGGRASDVLRLFGQPANGWLHRQARSALEKSAGVFSFQQDGVVRDISRLDPGAEDDAEGSWGGLTGFATTSGDAVSSVAARAWNNGE